MKLETFLAIKAFFDWGIPLILLAGPVVLIGVGAVKHWTE